MRLAVIDLGTNSVRFDIHEIGPERSSRLLHREKLMIRMGQDLFLSGKLSDESRERARAALRSFRYTADSMYVERVVACATSAMREASDGPEFLAELTKISGIPIRVISGEEESLLIATGILAFEQNLDSEAALLDIGGGSSELIFVEGRKAKLSTSLPLGVARLHQLFLKNSPPVDAPVDSEVMKYGSLKLLRKHVRKVLEDERKRKEWFKVKAVIGSSGTIRALVRIHRKETGKHVLSGDALKELIDRMTPLTLEKLHEIPGLDPRRADLIVAGAVVLDEFLRVLGAEKVRSTDYSLRDGLFIEEINRYKPVVKDPPAFSLDVLREKLARVGGNVKHAETVAAFCDRLFDRFSELHKLPKEFEVYLLAAAILHDIGECVSAADHELHSAYAVLNLDVPHMQTWEKEFVSELCRFHKGGKVRLEDIRSSKNGVLKERLMRLLSILRLADALDRSHDSAVKISQVRIERSEVTIYLSAARPLHLEILRAEQKKTLFEDVFDRKVMIKPSLGGS